MDLPLDMTATRLPFGENVIKLEPSNQLNEPENVEEGGQQQLYRHSPDIVKKLALSLSPCSHPPPLTTSQLKQKERGTSMANSSPSARRGEKSTQKLAGGEKQLQLSDIAEPAVEVQPATVKVHASRHGSSSSDRLNLPTSSVMEKEVTQGVLKEAMIHPTTVKAYSVSHDIKPTNQPQLNLASHGVNTTDQEPGKDGAGEREEGERERVKGGGTERERRNKEVTATSSIGDQLAGIAIHSVSSLAVIEGGDNHTPDSSQNLSQQPGPPNWSESQRRSLDSDAFYSSDSQPPSLKMIRLESPSPSPDSPLSLLVAQIDGQLPQQQDPECRYTTKGSPLSLLVAQMDTQSPQRLDPESSHGTGGSILSLLVSQMDAQSSHQQDTNLQNATKEPPSLVEQMDAQSQQQREPECHHTVEQSPLSQLIAQMDAQSGQQRDPEHQNLTEENHQIACSVSGGFICSPLPNGGEEEEEKEMEGERGRIEPTVVGCEREEPHDKVRGDGDGRVLERGGRDGYALHNIFGKFGGYKQKVQAGCWVKRNEAASRRGEKSSLTGQRSTTKGQNSNSVNCATEQPSTSSGQGSSGDRGFRHQHHDEGNLGEGVFDEHGTLEVDVVGTASQPATLEVDVEGAYSSADEMKTTGAAPLKDGPITSQVQQSGKGWWMLLDSTLHIDMTTSYQFSETGYGMHYNIVLIMKACGYAITGIFSNRSLIC